MNNVKIPKLMQRLERDPRGYPIPAGVYRDKDNKPHFTINDSLRRLNLIIEDRCPICAHRLYYKKWFVGGPLSAFDPNGSYIDPAMHYECMKYALQVCPYLAAPNYSKRIDDKTLSDDDTTIVIDQTMMPHRPVLFVAVETTEYDIKIVNPMQTYLRPLRPYTSIQYWQYGKIIRPEKAREILGGTHVLPAEARP